MCSYCALFSPGVRRAEVVNPRRDTCSREVLRHEVTAVGDSMT